MTDADALRAELRARDGQERDMQFAAAMTEAETLRAQLHGMQDGALVRDQAAEIERLRAERDELRKCLDPAVVAAAEMLQRNADAHPQGCCSKCTAALAKLTSVEAEAGVLRTALSAFVEHWDGYDMSEWNEDDKKGVRILEAAQAALATNADRDLAQAIHALYVAASLAAPLVDEKWLERKDLDRALAHSALTKCAK